MMVSYGSMSKFVRFSFILFIFSVILLGFQVFTGDEEYNNTEEWNPLTKDDHEGVDDADSAARSEHIPYPIILWWTPFTGETGTMRTCGKVKCFFTMDRHYLNHSSVKVFMFYGTDYKVGDLPVPRQSHHEWALMHEESPKNNYLFSHRDTMVLFNHTCTFRRNSHYPITTQHLENLQDLESSQYLVPTAEKNRLIEEEGLATIAYVQSDCGTPSDRDHLVQMLQRYMKVDSYGECLHNSDLPEHLRDPLKGMDHKDFYRYMARYKFVLALENALCEDYITEKFWRPFIVGSIPVVLGSPKSRDYLPANHSAIFVEDFTTIDDLVQFLQIVNKDDTLYNEYLAYKTTGVKNTKLQQEMRDREWGVSDWSRLNFIEGFECAVCNRLHENILREAEGRPALKRQAEWDHYGCPRPKRFSDSPYGSLERVNEDWWGQEYEETAQQARATLQLVRTGKNFDMDDILNRAYDYKHNGVHEHH